MSLEWTRPRNVPWIKAIWKLWMVSPAVQFPVFTAQFLWLCSMEPASKMDHAWVFPPWCFSLLCSSWLQCLCHENGKLLANIKDVSPCRKVNQNGVTIAVAKFGELLWSLYPLLIWIQIVISPAFPQ